MALPQPTKDHDQHLQDLKDHGYCLVEDALSSDQVAAIKNRMLDQAAAEKEIGRAPLEYSLKQREAKSHPNQRIYNLINKGDAFLPLTDYEKTYPLAQHILGEDAILSSLTGNIAWGEGDPMFLHEDQGQVPFFVEEAVVCNVGFMLTDFRDETGATRVVPGSHKERKPYADPYKTETVPAEGPAGTALVFDGRTLHGTGVNRTDQPRIGMFAYYCRPWIRTQEAMVFSIADDVLEKATDNQRRILSQQVWFTFGGTNSNHAHGSFIDRGLDQLRALSPKAKGEAAE